MSFSPWLQDPQGCLHQGYREQLLHISGKWLIDQFSWSILDCLGVFELSRKSGDGCFLQTAQQVLEGKAARLSASTHDFPKFVQNTRHGQEGTAQPKDVEDSICEVSCRKRSGNSWTHVWNPAGNTSRPLITRAAGQEKNCCILELLHYFRSG